MSLVKNIKENIYDEIKRRPYKAGEKLPGVRELAKLYEVSYVTMSNALLMLAQEGIIEQFPGKGSFVTDMVSKNSLALFVPDYFLGLKTYDPATDSTCLFGLMDIYSGILASVQKEKFNLHIIPIPSENMDVEKYYKLIMDKLNVSGAFFMSVNASGLIDRLSKANCPCCKLHTPGDPKYNYVAVDIEKGAYNIVKHLIKLGHKRVALISGGGDEKNIWFKGRYKGYYKALNKAKIKPRSEFIQMIDSHTVDDDILTERVDKLLALPESPTAIFVSSDVWALHIIKILQDKGVNVPGDVSVAGFDDYVESKVFDPPLTTVAQPFYQIGQRAFVVMKRLLLEPSERVCSIIEPNLIIRKSTAQPRKSKMKKVKELCMKE